MLVALFVGMNNLGVTSILNYIEYNSGFIRKRRSNENYNGNMFILCYC